MIARIFQKKMALPFLKHGGNLLRKMIGFQTEALQWIDLSSGLIEFIPRPEDIFIVTYPRSGTTLMQMLLHQLTTEGHVGFTHISEFSPFLDRSLAHHIHSAKDFEDLPNPRVLKSHLGYPFIPKGAGRYIYVERDGKDVAVSYFHFYKSHLGFHGSFAEFFNLFLNGEVMYGSWFEHVAGWRAHRKDPDILYLQYEDIKQDMEACLHQIIDFCRLDVPMKRFPEILEQCSFEFMKQHEDKFDHITGMMLEKGYKTSAFIREGKASSGNEYLTASQLTQFEEAQKTCMTRS
ncbi:MAG: sulfotransferase domain-containing protein [SAR324 cluster bacterium]|nr:sulfotransferase domain-containing protein [SAR324 cluster bacterium]